MEPGDLATWVAVIVAFLTAVWGVVSSITANRRVSKANELAAKSNRIAEDALQRAETSNAIALGANTLSEEANDYVKRSMAQQHEDSYVKWSVDWDADTTKFILTNKGRDTAVQPSAVLVGDGRHHVARSDLDVSAGETWTIPLDDISEKRRRQDESNKKRSKNPTPGVMFLPLQFREKVDLTLNWRSELGVPHSQEETAVVG